MMSPILPSMRALLAATLACLAIAANSPADPPRITGNRVGEPYQLLSNRLVFVNWSWIRPGTFGWFKHGRAMGIHETARLGEAEFRGVDSPHGIAIRVEPARREGPLFEKTQPWAAQGILVGTLLQENGRYRAWTRVKDADGKPAVVYYESTDGRHWEAPRLRNGPADQPANLVNLPGHNTFNIFIDPAAPVAERYKAYVLSGASATEVEQWRDRYPDEWLGRVVHPAGADMGVWGYVSADGLTWHKRGTILAEYTDTWIGGYHDPRLAKYVLYTRHYLSGPRAASLAPDPNEQANHSRRRAIGRTESDSFAAFPASRLILFPTTAMRPSEHLYTNCKTTIPGAPEQHLLFPTLYDAATDRTRVAVAASADGRTWEWLPGWPVLETAPPGEWDGGCVFALPELVELPNGDFALPYGGYNVPHKYPRHGAYAFNTGYAIWPKGRIIALAADNEGAFTTVAFLVPGTKLKINSVTDPTGSIKVEVADGRTGKPVPGRALTDATAVTGDQHWSIVRWGDADTLGVPAGQPVLLRFQMRKAKLYGVEFE